MKYLGFQSLIFAVLILVAPATVSACSCQETYSIPQAVERSSMVFVGTIRSIVSDKARDGIWYTRVAVEKMFKGTDPKTKIVDILAGNAMSDCSFTLGKEYFGTKWLFYIEQPEKKYFHDVRTNKAELSREKFIWASTCSRTRLADKAVDDLALLNAPEKYKGKTRLSGTIRDYDRAANVTFRLIGNGTSHSPTLHSSGYFEFFDFTPGKYTLEIDSAPGFVAYRAAMGGYQELEKTSIAGGVRNTLQLTIKTGEHAALDLRFSKAR